MLSIAFRAAVYISNQPSGKFCYHNTKQRYHHKIMTRGRPQGPKGAALRASSNGGDLGTSTAKPTVIVFGKQELCGAQARICLF